MAATVKEPESKRESQALSSKEQVFSSEEINTESQEKENESHATAVRDKPTETQGVKVQPRDKNESECQVKRTPTLRDIPIERQRVKGLEKKTENEELEYTHTT